MCAQRSRQAGRIVTIVAVGREAVDVARVDAGILTGREDRLEAKHKLWLRGVAVTVVGRLADPCHGHLPAQTSSRHAWITSHSDRSSQHHLFDSRS